MYPRKKIVVPVGQSAAVFIPQAVNGALNAPVGGAPVKGSGMKKKKSGRGPVDAKTAKILRANTKY